MPASSSGPSVHRRDDLPSHVTICEVGPRDGLQIEKTVVATADKIAFIDKLAAAGLPMIEVTSFVPASWIPQLADGREVLQGLTVDPSIRLPVLVPNGRGLEGALAAGAKEIAVFVSATESFALRNLNRSKAEALDMATRVVQRATTEGLRVRGYISMVFGDPWEGAVPTTAAADVAANLVAAGCSTVSLGDTTGVATPGHVHAVLNETARRGVEADQIALHFHDSYGQALANVMAGLEAGVTEFDSSAGGLGGCPYAQSATGNLATEDLVWMLHGLGIHTGVDLEQLVQTSLWMAQILGRPSPSRVVTALTPHAA